MLELIQKAMPNREGDTLHLALSASTLRLTALTVKASVVPTVLLMSLLSIYVAQRA